ncbi:MAG: hypothetical protein L0228_01340 [Planctomycetes bacterium]|nr:hypothetical protein [Planctomycetota bacterium]
MQLGKAIVGAIIGAAIGIGVLVAVYLIFKIDKVWLALPVAILTGLGVRMMVSTTGHASYLRGAITGVLALGAYLLGWYAVAGLAQRYASAASEPRAKVAAEQPAESGDAEKATDEEKAPEAKAPEPERPRPAAARGQKAQMPKGFSTMDFVWLCVSALVAYELGRGTMAKPVTVVKDTTTEMPPGAHPDA